MAIRRLQTEQEVEDGGYDPFSADEGFLRQVVSAPTPAPPPALSAPPAPVVAAPAPVVPAPAPVVPAPAPILDMSDASPEALAWWDSVTAAQNQSLQNAISSGQLPEGFDPSVIYNSLGISPPDVAMIQQAYEYNKKEQTQKALEDYFSNQWRAYGIDPTIKGINRAGELARILEHYGITDVSKLGLKQTRYPDDEEPDSPLRGQLTYGDQNYGTFIGIDSKGRPRYRTDKPLEYLEDYGNQGYRLAGSSAGTGVVDFVLLKDEQGNLRKDAQGRPIVVPQWKSSSDLGDIQPLLAIASIIPSPLQPFAQAANAAISISQGNIAGGIASLAGMAGITPTIGNAIADTVGITGLTAAQTAAIGNAAINAGVTAAQGGDLGDVAKAVVPAIIAPVISNQVDQALQTAFGPDVAITGNTTVDNALSTGARDLANAAVNSAITGQDIDLTKTLLPAIAGAVPDATDGAISQKQAAAGLNTLDKVLSGNDIGINDILGIVKAASTPTKTSGGLKAEGEDETVDTTLPTETDVEEEEASFFPEFDNPLLTQEPTSTQLPPVDVVQQLQQSGLEELLPELFPEPTAAPISDLEKALFQEANVMPEGPQQVVTTAEKETPVLPELPAQPIEQDVQDYIQSVINAEAALPKDETQQVDITGNLPDQTLYELPEAPVVQDLYQPPGQLEGPSTIETTGTKLPETPIIPLEDLLPVIEPDLSQGLPTVPDDTQRYEVTGTKLPETPIIPLEDLPEVVAPDLSQGLPTVTAAPAPSPAPAPAPAPSPAPAPAAQSKPFDLEALLASLNRGQTAPQYTTYNPVIAQLKDLYDLEKMFSVGRGDETSIEDLLNIIGASRRS